LVGKIIVRPKLKVFVSLAYATIFLAFAGMGTLQSHASEEDFGANPSDSTFIAAECEDIE
jgi:hypothetical protein